ncbi:MAG: glycosyltransferase [Lachnospiraceae bacterium]|nr:glycosyltransferase [Lachnospiraceae bacterium]
MNTQARNLKKPLLSISLLSSGRKETIWKCLDSLLPIMEAVDSELIIVDTGCDEETHERMLTYTKQVIRFTWCNDFSRARNAGLKQARGEWFLFIDDDEWFTDVEELVAFFTAGEYKDYGCANYIQRNYTHKSGKTYRDAWVTRLIRLDKDTRFVSSIHEYLYPVRGKCKLIHSPVDHYGYIFKNEKEKYAHSRRNISLLVGMIEKERNNPRWWVHLANEYRGLREYHKLEELCEEGIETFKGINSSYVNRQRGTFYVGRIMVELKRRDYEKARELYEGYLTDRRSTQVCRARLHGMGAEIYYGLREYEKCESCCRSYLEIYERFHEDEMECLSQSSFFVREGFEAAAFNNVCGLYAVCGLRRQESSILKEYFYRIDWEAKGFRLHSAIPAELTEWMGKLPYEEAFTQIAAVMMNKKGIDRLVIGALRKIEEKEKEEEAAADFMRLCRIFAGIQSSSNHYVLYLRLRYLDYLGEREPMEEIFGRLLGRVVNFWDLEDSVFEIALKNGVSLENIFTAIRYENWKKGTDLLFEKARGEKLRLRKQIIDGLSGKENIRFSYFRLKWAEWECREAEEETDYHRLHGKLERFYTGHLEFYRNLYRESVFTGEMELLPGVCRLAVRLEQVFKEEKAGNISRMREALKACLKVYPPMDSTLRRFAQLFGSHKKEELKEADRAREEMAVLGAQIREMAEELLAQGLYGEAWQIWQQLVILLPEDANVLRLGERIKEGLS